jgi:hypothetical protein
MTGHLPGAAGGLEAAISVLAVHHQAVPPTINLDCPDPDCDLDYVPHTSRQMPIRHALSNSFGRRMLHCCSRNTKASAPTTHMRAERVYLCVSVSPWRVGWMTRLTWCRLHQAGPYTRMAAAAQRRQDRIREQDVSYEMNEPGAYALEHCASANGTAAGGRVPPARPVQQILREALARGADRARR